LSRFSTFYTALPADIKVFFFACENDFSGFVAQCARLFATRLSTQLRYKSATFVGVFLVKGYSVGAHE
jgi:hypothetical protein